MAAGEGELGGPRLEAVAELHGHEDAVWGLAWHPSRELLASCGADRSVRLWGPRADHSGWECVCVLDGVASRTVRQVAWSPDGGLLCATSFDGTTCVWEIPRNLEEPSLLATLEAHQSEVKGCAYSPSGAQLATCGRDKSVIVWQVDAEGEYDCLAVLQGHTQDVKSVAWHPGATAVLVSTSYDDSVRVWEDDGGGDWVCAQVLGGQPSTVWSVSFERDNGTRRMATCDGKGGLRVWAWSPTGSASASADRGVVEGGGRWGMVVDKPGVHSRAAFCVDWSRTLPAPLDASLLASCGGDNSIVLSRVREGEEASLEEVLRVDRAHGAVDVNAVRWGSCSSCASTLASAGDDGLVKLWRLVA
jgi:WD40 repeat protein